MILLFVPLLLARPALAAPTTLSAGKEVALTTYLTPEKPTVFLFYKPSSSMERRFAADLERSVGPGVGFTLIPVKNGDEPLARRYEVRETPTAIIYDRRARVTARSSDADAIQAAVTRAAGVMRIDWAEEGDPRLDATRKILGRPAVAGILRTMSLQPEYLDLVNQLAQKEHFSDGYLPRRVKEMIATYVSALNHCKY